MFRFNSWSFLLRRVDKLFICLLKYSIIINRKYLLGVIEIGKMLFCVIND